MSGPSRVSPPPLSPSPLSPSSPSSPPPSFSSPSPRIHRTTTSSSNPPSRASAFGANVATTTTDPYPGTTPSLAGTAVPSSRRRPASSTATVNGDDGSLEVRVVRTRAELSDPGSTNSNAAGVAPAFSSANVRRRVSPTTTAPKSTSVVVARAFARLGWHSTGISTTPAVVESDRVVCNVCAIFGAKVTVTRDDIPAERFPGWSYSTPNDPRCSTGNAITRNADVPYDTFVMVTRFRYRFPTAKSRKTTRDGLDANAAPASVAPRTGSRVYRRSGSAIRDAATSNDARSRWPKPRRAVCDARSRRGPRARRSTSRRRSRSTSRRRSRRPPPRRSPRARARTRSNSPRRSRRVPRRPRPSPPFPRVSPPRARASRVLAPRATRRAVRRLETSPATRATPPRPARSPFRTARVSRWTPRWHTPRRVPWRPTRPRPRAWRRACTRRFERAPRDATRVSRRSRVARAAASSARLRAYAPSSRRRRDRISASRSACAFWASRSARFARAASSRRRNVSCGLIPSASNSAASLRRDAVRASCADRRAAEYVAAYSIAASVDALSSRRRRTSSACRAWSVAAAASNAADATASPSLRRAHAARLASDAARRHAASRSRRISRRVDARTESFASPRGGVLDARRRRRRRRRRRSSRVSTATSPSPPPRPSSRP